MSLTMAEKTGEEWWFAEVVSFFCRCFAVMAMACLAVGGNSYEKSAIDYICITALAFGFYINCLEFSRPAKENLMIHFGGFTLSAVTGLLIVLLASQESHSSGKYHGAMFCGLNVLGSGLMCGQFYLCSK